MLSTIAYNPDDWLWDTIPNIYAIVNLIHCFSHPLLQDLCYLSKLVIKIYHINISKFMSNEF